MRYDPGLGPVFNEFRSTQADHGALWFAKLSGLKHRAVVMAKRIVDEAMLVAGGGSYFSANELSRLYRDVLAGAFHPSDPESAHSTAATAWKHFARPPLDATSSPPAHPGRNAPDHGSTIATSPRR